MSLSCVKGAGEGETDEKSWIMKMKKSLDKLEGCHYSVSTDHSLSVLLGYDVVNVHFLSRVHTNV